MDIANCVVALGGDITNTVPKYAVTPAEICVLQAIHGADAVTDIEKVGEEERSNRGELDRLRDPLMGYGRALNGNGKLIISEVFPGAGARVPQTLDELELEDSQWKADRVVRKRPPKKTKAAADVMA